MEEGRMNILITGAHGFVGRNLSENLKTIRDGRNRTRPGIRIDEIYEFDRKNTLKELDVWCEKADFVFHFAGVHRYQDSAGIYAGNTGAASRLLKLLEKHGNQCPVVFSSSIQAALSGRFGFSPYGYAKRECEAQFFRHEEKTGAPVYVYRFPNLVGKWARPDYNSAVATFCDAVAKDRPFTVHDPETKLELLFIDDLLEEMYDALEGHPHRADYPEGGPLNDDTDARITVNDGQTPWPSKTGRYCYVPVTYKATLGQIASLLCTFHEQQRSHLMPRIPKDSLEKKLYSVYVSYLPKQKAVYDLDMIRDDRGSFTEIIATTTHGQFSVNVCRPGAVKGQHWHNSKWELFIVMSGHGLIRERRIGTNKVMEYEVTSDRIQAVHMIPGCTHSIQNLSDKEDLIILMWANEIFDPERPDTFKENV